LSNLINYLLGRTEATKNEIKEAIQLKRAAAILARRNSHNPELNTIELASAKLKEYRDLRD